MPSLSVIWHVLCIWPYFLLKPSRSQSFNSTQQCNIAHPNSLALALLPIDEVFRRVVKLIWWRPKLSLGGEVLIWSWAQDYHWRRGRSRRRRRWGADLAVGLELPYWRRRRKGRRDKVAGQSYVGLPLEGSRSNAGAHSLDRLYSIHCGLPTALSLSLYRPCAHLLLYSEIRCVFELCYTFTLVAIRSAFEPYYTFTLAITKQQTTM